MILLKCENMFAMLILHALILHSGDNIEILPNPSMYACVYVRARVHLCVHERVHAYMHLCVCKCICVGFI